MTETTDYTQADLSTLLSGVLTTTELGHLLPHYLNGAVVETDTGGPYNPLPEVADSNGSAPNLLLLDGSGETIDLDNFADVISSWKTAGQRNRSSYSTARAMQTCICNPYPALAPVTCT